MFLAGPERNPPVLSSPKSDKTPFHIPGKAARERGEHWNPLLGWVMSQRSSSSLVSDSPGLWRRSWPWGELCSCPYPAPAPPTANQDRKPEPTTTSLRACPKPLGYSHCPSCAQSCSHSQNSIFFTLATDYFCSAKMLRVNFYIWKPYII